MLIFWLAVIVLALGTAFFLLRPLYQGGDEAKGANPDVAIYKSQLDELQRDLAAEAIGPEEARAAEAEISRRLLAADREAPVGRDLKSQNLSSRSRMAIAFLIVLVMPVAATMIYIGNGKPAYEAQPYVDKNDEVEKWIKFGQVYMQTERYEDAQGAFAQALGVSGPRADLYEMYGEAILFSGGGEISDRAVDAFQTAIKLDPTRERSQYILGEWLYRSGEREDAVRVFIDLLEEAKDADFRAYLDERIKAAISEIRADLSGEVPIAEPQKPLGLSGDDLARVNQMVAGLAARLEQDPNDLEGWLRLIRSYTVLGDLTKAHAALQAATFAFLTKPNDLQEILDLAIELELSKGPELPAGTEGLVFPPEE
jgi:cytochrome c-type biogenesis protein CcmH